MSSSPWAWPAWLARKPTRSVRIAGAAGLLVLATMAMVVPSNLHAFPLIIRLVAIGVGGAITASGMVTWERRPGNAIGPLLVLSGALWIVGRMQGAEWPPLALAANLANSLSQGLLLAVLVVFPSGRIGSRAGAVIVAVGTVAVVSANLIEATSVEMRRTAGMEAPNALYIALAPSVRSILQAVSRTAVLIGLLTTLGWLVMRWWRATSPARRTYLPVFLAGIGIASILFVTEALLRSGSTGPGDRLPIAAVQIASFALLPVGIAIGVLRDRMARGAVADLVVELGETPPAERLREALANALGDPTLEIAYWSQQRGAYVDPNGVAIDASANQPRRAVTLLERAGQPLAAILHDPALADDPGLVAAVGSAVRLAVENERLTEEVEAQLAEVRASRTRIVEASDAARRQVERDLHDGAQQRLVALSLALRRARAQLPGEAAGEAASTLDEAADQLRLALAELRSLARGIHPAILTEAGLGAAVRALARDAAVPVDVTIILDRRLPDPIEATAYFLVAEALANVAKYAPAASVALSVTAGDDELRVEIADDGMGGADPAAGSGLRGLADRVAAVGGALRIESPPGAGTRLLAEIPLAGAPA